MSIAGNTSGQMDKSRLFFPGLASLYESIAPYSYSIIRFVAGAILVYHGYGKLFGGNIQGVADHVVTPLGLPMPLGFPYFLGVLLPRRRTAGSRSDARQRVLIPVSPKHGVFGDPPR